MRISISTCVDSELHHEPDSDFLRPDRNTAQADQVLIHLPAPSDWNGDHDRNRPTTMHQRLPKIELMQDLRAPIGTRGPRYALVAVAVALFGLLSMHGWGSHTGAHSMGATSQSAIAMIAANGTIRHHHSGPAASEPDTPEPIVAGHSAGMGSEEPVGENGAGLLGLCLAVLAGLLLLGIALLLARRGVRIARTLLPAWQPLRFIGRDRDPPGLRMLCVIRC